MLKKQMYRLPNGVTTTAKGQKILLMRETVKRLGNTYDVWYVVINDVPGNQHMSREEATKAAFRHVAEEKRPPEYTDLDD